MTRPMPAWASSSEIRSNSCVERARRSGLVTINVSVSRKKWRHSASFGRWAAADEICSLSLQVTDLGIEPGALFRGGGSGVANDHGAAFLSSYEPRWDYADDRPIMQYAFYWDVICGGFRPWPIVPCELAQFGQRWRGARRKEKAPAAVEEAAGASS